MNKWIGAFVSVLMAVVLVYFLAPFQMPAPQGAGDSDVKPVPAIFGKTDEEKERKDEDTQLIQILKRVQEVLDGWLKSLNERIESKDVSRLEVRFLEVLRSVVEWVKAKVDAKIDSSKGQREAKVAFQDIRRRSVTGGM